jgi:hypothetical protein
MDSEGSRVSNDVEDALGDQDRVEKIEGWEPLERKPFDGTVVDIMDTSWPPWPPIEEVECITTVGS